MNRFRVATVVLALAVLALVVSSLVGVTEYTCEVCVTYKGRTECRTGQGRTKRDAIDKAQTAACAVMTNGMDEVVNCGNTPPSSVSCD